jgi:acetyl esterase/lipase
MYVTWADVTDEERAQARRVTDLVEQLSAILPPVHTVDPAETRRLRAEGRGALPAPVTLDSAVDRHVSGPTGALRLRLFVPDEVHAVYLHVHGGGWTFGGPDQQDLHLDALARAVGVAVASVGYRLAPEHPFPAAVEDCEAAALWLLAHAATELGTDRLLIGGESAGAHLAVLTLLRLRARGAVDRVLGANLMFGMYDLALTPSARAWGERNLVLSTPIIQWFVDGFVPSTTATDRQRPEISPLYADLSGLPPALFSVGDLDPVVDDSLFMAARWRLAGNEALVNVYPESVHGFVAFPSDVARRAFDDQFAFLRRLLARQQAERQEEVD